MDELETIQAALDEVKAAKALTVTRTQERETAVAALTAAEAADDAAQLALDTAETEAAAKIQALKDLVAAL